MGEILQPLSWLELSSHRETWSQQYSLCSPKPIPDIFLVVNLPNLSETTDKTLLVLWSHLFIIKIVTLVVYLIQSWFWLFIRISSKRRNFHHWYLYCIYSWGLFGAARTLSVEYVAPIRSKTTASDDDGCTPGCTGWSSESGFADTSRPNSIAHDEYAFAVSDTSFDKLSALTHQEIMLNDDVRNEMSINF